MHIGSCHPQCPRSFAYYRALQWEEFCYTNRAGPAACPARALSSLLGRSATGQSSKRAHAIEAFASPSSPFHGLGELFAGTMSSHLHIHTHTMRAAHPARSLLEQVNLAYTPARLTGCRCSFDCRSRTAGKGTKLRLGQLPIAHACPHRAKKPPIR